MAYNHPQLPAGLDPIQAGKWGLWYLGQREHRKSLYRCVTPRRVPGGNAARRFVHLLAPWTVSEYPGSAQIIAELLGLSRSSAHTYLYCRSKPLPAKHVATLERLCRDRAAAYLALADEFAGKVKSV